MRGDGLELGAMLISGLWPAFCPADETGRPLMPAVLLDDPRGAAYASESGLLPFEMLARWEWLRTHSPDVSSRTKLIFTAHSYALHRLTGKYCVDVHTARGFGGIFSPAEGTWNAALASKYGIGLDLLPSIVDVGTLAGGMTRAAAADCGAPEGTPVVVGTTDTIASLAGCGATESGDLMLYLGSFGLGAEMRAGIDAVVFGPGGAEPTVRWAFALPNSGRQMDWTIAGLTGRTRVSAPMRRWLEEQAGRVEPSGAGVVFIRDCRLAGTPDRGDMQPAGALLGFGRGCTVPMLYRAMMEGLMFEVRRAMQRESAEKPLPLRSRPILLAGGGARSAVWRQIAADVLRSPVLASERSLGSYGGAAIAAAAMEKQPLEAYSMQVRTTGSVSHPRPSEARMYDAAFSTFERIADSLGVPP